MTPWLLVPTALGLKSIPALEEATTSTPHILPFPCGFSLCQLVLLALNSFSTVHIPNWGGGQSNSAILKSWQYPKCICYQLPAPTPLLTILGFKMPNSVFFFFSSSCKNTRTHQHTCVLGLKSQVPSLSLESVFMVGCTCPQIEALNGNADRSLTKTAQTRVQSFPRYLHFVCQQNFQAQDRLERISCTPLFEANLRARGHSPPKKKVAQDMQSTQVQNILGYLELIEIIGFSG